MDVEAAGATAAAGVGLAGVDVEARLSARL